MNNVDIFKIAEAIAMLLEQFGIVVDNSSVNLVPYLQELGDKIVAYKRGTSILWMIVGAIIILIAIIIFIVGCVQDWEVGHYVVLVVGIVVGAIIIIAFAHTYIACNTFPEKVILDYIESTINNTNSSR